MLSSCTANPAARLKASAPAHEPGQTTTDKRGTHKEHRLSAFHGRGDVRSGVDDRSEAFEPALAGDAAPRTDRVDVVRMSGSGVHRYVMAVLSPVEPNRHTAVARTDHCHLHVRSRMRHRVKMRLRQAFLSIMTVSQARTRALVGSYIGRSETSAG